MTTAVKTPPIKETVGAQYICFGTAGTNGEYTKTYDAAVEKTEVVKSVKVSENTENTPVYGSGSVYTQSVLNSSTEISVEVIAFASDTLSKMRADTVDVGGLILSGKPELRPYFAYGKVVKMQNGGYKYEWFPKCQLTANSDDTKTSEDKFSEQNDTLTILALPFDNLGNIKTSVMSDYKIPDGLTEEKFFAKPILTVADLKAATGTLPKSNTPGNL